MTPPFRQAALAAAMAVVPAALVAPSQAQAPIYGAPQAQQASPPRPADSAPAPLTPETVLDASSASAPDILARLAEIRAAQGGALSAQGAFDVIFSADGFSRVTGFWDGSILNTDVRRNIGAFNGTIYGGYKISDGSFPIYEDINFTNTGGEFKIGAFFSLLRDREIDPRRFGVLDADIAARQARLDFWLTSIGIQRQALISYWRWVALGRQWQVYQDLLDIALRREAGLIRQVERGALPEIAVTENRQNITRRQILVAQAQRDFAAAANQLSFYLRDAAGAPIVPEPQFLPPADPIAVDSAQIARDWALVETTTVPDALARRPELAGLRLALQRAKNTIALSKNELKPRLDVNFEVSRDVGAVAEGGISRDSTDTIIAFKFSVPFQQRGAIGKLAKAEAERDALIQRQRRLADQIEIELRNILVELEAAGELVDLAAQDVVQSDTMTNAERRRFEIGASDFFVVNVREETAADARIRYHFAELQARIALANYDAAIVDLDRLRIADMAQPPM